MSNLQPLCKWHHRMKHVARWKLVALDGHRFRWTTANGNHIDVHPEPVIADLPEPVPRAEASVAGGLLK